MTYMEMRAWITIAGFPTADDEDAWGPFTAALERDGANLGAVLSWEGRDIAQVVMSANVDDRSQFARAAVVRVVDALQAAGLGDLYPTRVEIEPADDRELVA